MRGGLAAAVQQDDQLSIWIAPGVSREFDSIRADPYMHWDRCSRKAFSCVHLFLINKVIRAVLGTHRTSLPSIPPSR
jgi:hypothetical protein